MKTSIVLADDHQVMRQGLQALLHAEPDFCVVGEAGDGVETMRLVDRLKPDVLVLDIRMPGLNGLEVVRQIHRRSARTRVVVLSMHANEAYVLETLRYGAAGYVLKDSSVADLVRAVREALAGRRYLSAPLTERAIAAYAERASTGLADPYDQLTDREREVLQLAVQGRTNSGIATLLCISQRTVETHRAKAMQKLDLHSHTALIRFAVQKGFLALEDESQEMAPPAPPVSPTPPVRDSRRTKFPPSKRIGI